MIDEYNQDLKSMIVGLGLEGQEPIGGGETWLLYGWGVNLMHVCWDLSVHEQLVAAALDESVEEVRLIEQRGMIGPVYLGADEAIPVYACIISRPDGSVVKSRSDAVNRVLEITQDGG